MTYHYVGHQDCQCCNQLDYHVAAGFHLLCILLYAFLILDFIFDCFGKIRDSIEYLAEHKVSRFEQVEVRWLVYMFYFSNLP